VYIVQDRRDAEREAILVASTPDARARNVPLPARNQSAVTALLQRLMLPREIWQNDEIGALMGEIDDYQNELETQNEELHVIQHELSDSRDRYFELYELAPSSYLTLSERGTIVEGNQRLASLLGAVRPSFLGRPLVAYLTPDSADAFTLALRRLFAERVRLDLELILCRVDGAIRHVRVEAEAREPDKGARQCRVVLTDVTDLKMAESRIRALNFELAEHIAELTRKNRELAAEIEQRTALSSELERNQLELRRLSRQVMTSQDDERRRIARELHDETGQSLGALVAELRALEDSDEDPALKSAARRLRDRVSGALRNVRRIAHGLHPSTLASCGLAPALERFVADQRTLHGLEVTTQLVGFQPEQRLPAALELTLFRATQEAFTNIVKHAGAHRVSVVLVEHGKHVRLVIEDDGRGFDVDATLAAGAGPGLGLVGMRERVGLLGGELQLESAPDKGTTLAISIPLEHVDGAHPSPDRR
jgi:PAS domain S-box-containing protein